MEWASLALITVIYLICAYLTYHRDLHDKPWYMPVAIAFGTTTVVIWYYMIRHIGDRDRIYVYNMCWDTIMCGVYYLLPIFVFGVKLDRIGVFGLCLMIIGSVILKSRG
jgi:hypothetical protein